MTFSETIDALIHIYEEGMKAESYEALKSLNLDSGVCWAANKAFGCDLEYHYEWLDYRPINRGSFWFKAACQCRRNKPISEIIETCIRPRLELLKRIQKDLQTKES